MTTTRRTPDASPTPGTTGAQHCFRLVYRSHSLLEPDDRVAMLGDIFTKARASNRRAGITGALLITDHYFVQALEGEEARVRALYERIRLDPRHEDLRLVDSRTDGIYVFTRWAMAEISKSGQADIPLHSDAASGGIGPAASRPVTREQDVVVRLMRNTIGADTL